MAGALDGKVAVITGAASGIGLAGAEAFVREGARVVMVDIDGAAVTAAAKRIDIAGDSTVGVECDVRDEEALAAAFDLGSGRWGHVDVVWNNAGVESFAPLVMATDDDYRRVFDVNVLGVLHGTKLGLSRLPDGGAIIQTASVAGLSGVPMQTLYAASKAAVVSLRWPGWRIAGWARPGVAARVHRRSSRDRLRGRTTCHTAHG